MVINGKIDTPGEVDFYQFDVTAACELSFGVRPSHAALAKKFRPEIGVFAKRPSFLDSDQLDRLAFADVEQRNPGSTSKRRSRVCSYRSGPNRYSTETVIVSKWVTRVHKNPPMDS